MPHHPSQEFSGHPPERRQMNLNQGSWNELRLGYRQEDLLGMLDRHSKQGAVLGERELESLLSRSVNGGMDPLLASLRGQFGYDTEYVTKLYSSLGVSVDLHSEVETPGWLRKLHPKLPVTMAMTPLMEAAMQRSGAPNISLLLRAGADPNWQNKDGISPLLLAALIGHRDNVAVLLGAGADPNLVLSMGRLSDSVEQEVRDYIVQYRKKLAKSRASEREPAPLGEKLSLPSLTVLKRTPIDDGLTKRGRQFAAGDMSKLAKVKTEASKGELKLVEYDAEYQEQEGGPPISQQELNKRTFALLQKGPIDAYAAAMKLFELLRSPYQLNLFARALTELRFEKGGRGLAFHQLAMTLQAHPPQHEILKPLLQPIEGLVGHPNESDVYALLSGPHASKRGNPVVDRVFRALPYGPDQTLPMQCLSRIGVLTNSASRWKADAMSVSEQLPDGERKLIEPSLLEAFGLERERAIAPRSSGDDMFGPQFVYRGKLDRGALFSAELTGINSGIGINQSQDVTGLVVMRRAYLLCKTGRSALIIRLSSPEFGRDRLARPFYLIEDLEASGISDELLIHPPMSLFREEFASLQPLSFEQYRCADLLSRLEHFLLRFGSFKFDTQRTAWAHSDSITGQTATELVGAHHSRGFPAFVRRLQHFHEQAVSVGKSLSLCFISPHWSPEIPHEFEFDGMRRRKLPVDDDVVEQLTALSETPDNSVLPISEELRAFLQNGILNRGELVASID